MEEFRDGSATGFFELSSASPCEMNVVDYGLIITFQLVPIFLIPLKPCVTLLIENIERLVAKLGKFSAPASPALYGFVFKYLANDVNLLAFVNLVPDTLKNLPKGRTVRIGTTHQARNVFKAHVTHLQLFVVQAMQAPRALNLMPLESVVYFFDSELLGVCPELGLRPQRPAAI